MRQRSEQKGKNSSVARTTFRQVGQKRALGVVLMTWLILEGSGSSRQRVLLRLRHER